MRSGRVVKPLIGISCCTKQFGVFGMPNHAASNTYVRATDEIVHGVPVLLPANGSTCDIETLLEHLDGIILTGSRSNVHPSYYDGPPHAEGTWEDLNRDGTTLPLIRAAVARGMPVLAICRGFQELNVAMGGSLHQRLQDLPDRIDHSTPMQASVKLRQGKAHAIRVTPGGWLHGLAGTTEIAVNSLHNQGVDRLAPGPGGGGHRARRPDRGGARGAYPRRAGAGLRHGHPVAPGIRLADRHRLPPDLRVVRRSGARLYRPVAARGVGARGGLKRTARGRLKRPARGRLKRPARGRLKRLARGRLKRLARGRRPRSVRGRRGRFHPKCVVQPRAGRPDPHEVGAPGNGSPPRQQQHDEARHPGDTQQVAGLRKDGRLARQTLHCTHAR